MTIEQEQIRSEVRRSIGNQIQQARQRAGFTTRQLADMCGLSHSHIVRIESGRYAVTVDSVGDIAHALGLRLELV